MRKARFGIHVRVCDVRDDFGPSVLLHGYMHDRRLSAELHIFDFVCGRSGLRPSQKLDMEGYCVWLVLFCQSCIEMCFDYFQYAASSSLISVIPVTKHTDAYHPVT